MNAIFVSLVVFGLALSSQAAAVPPPGPFENRPEVAEGIKTFAAQFKVCEVQRDAGVVLVCDGRPLGYTCAPPACSDVLTPTWVGSLLLDVGYKFVGVRSSSYSAGVDKFYYAKQ